MTEPLWLESKHFSDLLRVENLDEADQLSGHEIKEESNQNDRLLVLKISIPSATQRY